MMLPACRRQIPKTAWQQPEGFDPSGRSFKSHLRSVVYPYSVVAGGVESSGDVEEAVARDPLVKDHYDDINVRHLEPVKLRHDTMAYVSFRKHGQIYWTSSKVSLPKGERVLSDGANCIRSRCGNRISWEPRGPVLENKSEEPTSGQLNTAEVRGQSLEEMPIPDVPMAPPFENWVIPNPVPVVLEGGAPVADAGTPGGGIIGGGGGGGGGAAPMGSVAPNGAGPLLGVLLTPGQSTTSQTIVNGVTNVVNPVYIWPLNVTPPVATPTLIATLPPSSTPVPVLTPLTGPPAVTPPYLPPVTTPPGTPPDTPKPPPNTPPGTNPPDTPPPPGPPPPGDRPPATPPCDHPDQPGTPPVTPPAAVPEPSTIGMMVGGVALMLVFRRRRGV